jgi:protein-disulfide isomerase
MFVSGAARVNRHVRTFRLAEVAGRDNDRVADVNGSVQPAPARAMPRRGRFWVVLILLLALGGLGYSLVNISTQKANKNVIRIKGVEEAQQLFGGVPQEGSRLGSSDAPVTIQLFNDVQCSDCREAFLETVPGLTEKYARPGSVQILYRHYSNSENAIEEGFYGVEAAAEQGYGWQYAYLFFRNQEEAEKFGVTEEENNRAGLKTDFLTSLAGGVEELNGPEWEEAMETAREPDSAITRRLEADEELGSKLGIRYGQAMIVTGPHGTETLQENAKLGEVEEAIAKVE